MTSERSNEKSVSNLDRSMPKKKSNGSDNIIVRMLDADITHIEAGWRKFEIIFEDTVLTDGDLCYGFVNWDEYTVRFNARMTPALALETVLHELTHIVLMTGGYGETETDQVIEAKNEDLTIQVSRGFLQLYRLNPKLMMIISELMCKETPFKQ